MVARSCCGLWKDHDVWQIDCFEGGQAPLLWRRGETRENLLWALKITSLPHSARRSSRHCDDFLEGAIYALEVSKRQNLHTVWLNIKIFNHPSVFHRVYKQVDEEPSNGFPFPICDHPFSPCLHSLHLSHIIYCTYSRCESSSFLCYSSLS